VQRKRQVFVKALATVLRGIREEELKQYSQDEELHKVMEKRMEGIEQKLATPVDWHEFFPAGLKIRHFGSCILCYAMLGRRK
jgi:hypothetical protein